MAATMMNQASSPPLYEAIDLVSPVEKVSQFKCEIQRESSRDSLIKFSGSRRSTHSASTSSMSGESKSDAMSTRSSRSSSLRDTRSVASGLQAPLEIDKSKATYGKESYGKDSRSSTKHDEEEPCEESLPSYSPALTKKGLLLMKAELSMPFSRARNRSWRMCLAELDNTQLKLTYWQLGGILEKTETYSLQFAEIGLATDYEKRPNSFRLRVETRQLMFDCETRDKMLGWLVALQMAISLALPLELRQLPEEVKRRRNRQRDRERRQRREEERRRRAEGGGSPHDRSDGSRRHRSSSTGHDGSSRSRNSDRQHSHNHHHHSPPTTPPSSPRSYRSSTHLDQSPRSVRTNSSRSSDLTIEEEDTTENIIGDSSACEDEDDEDEDDEDETPHNTPEKWAPHRRSSRFTEKDFPHLLLNTSWEGKNVLYKGRWAQVRKRAILFV